MLEMNRGPMPASGMLHPLQAVSESERIVIVGTGEQAAIAFEYFTYDSPHEVVAFSAEPGFVKTSSFQGLPVVPLDRLVNVYPPTEYQAFVAISSTRSTDCVGVSTMQLRLLATIVSPMLAAALSFGTMSRSARTRLFSRTTSCNTRFALATTLSFGAVTI